MTQNIVVLFVRTATFKHRDKEQLHADLSYDYGGKIIPEAHEGNQILNFYGSILIEKGFGRDL